MKLKYLWPTLYSGLLSKEISELEISENEVDCDHCIKARPRYQKKDYYLPELKCCTFQPFLPNFAVGGILSDQTGRFAEAQKVIQQMIDEKAWTLPIGIVASPKYQIEFNKNKAEIFGRDKDFLCPYYDSSRQNCGIWKFRGSVCTSFYCKSSFGKKGKNFWQKVSDFQSYIEMAILEEFLVHQGFSPRQVSEQVSYINISNGDYQKNKLSDREYKKIWLEYANDPKEFYIKSYNFALKLKMNEFQESLGELGLKLEKSVIHYHGKLVETVK